MFSKSYIRESDDYKRLTINACKNAARKYRKPLNKVFFLSDYCALCKIYKRYSHQMGFMCFGCFMAHPHDGKPACTHYKSYIRAESEMHRCIMLFTQRDIKKNENPVIYHKCIVAKPCEAMIKRAEFFDARIIEFENEPSWKFHPDTKCNFNLSFKL